MVLVLNMEISNMMLSIHPPPSHLSFVVMEAFVAVGLGFYEKKDTRTSASKLKGNHIYYSALAIC